VYQPQEEERVQKCWAKTNFGEPNRQGFYFFSSNFNLHGSHTEPAKTLWVSQKPTCFDFSSSNFKFAGPYSEPDKTILVSQIDVF
jgi:hypothetical protein